jgi:hypothetical protein
MAVYPDAGLRGWVLEIDVGIPSASFFLIVLAAMIQLLLTGLVKVYMLNNDVKPAPHTASFWDKCRTSTQFWVRAIFLVVVTGILGTMGVVSTCTASTVDVEITSADHLATTIAGIDSYGSLNTELTFSKTKFQGGRRANTVDYGWKIINEEDIENAIKLPNSPDGKERYNISHALSQIKAFPAVITMEQIAGEAIQEGNCGRWHMLFWYSVALIVCTSLSSSPREFFLVSA